MVVCKVLKDDGSFYITCALGFINDGINSSVYVLNESKDKIICLGNTARILGY